jgi:hypothetical protein
LAGDKFWTDYTLTLKARKISGLEGFLNLFRIAKNGDRIWRNIGGPKSIKNVGTFWEKRKFCKFFLLLSLHQVTRIQYLRIEHNFHIKRACPFYLGRRSFGIVNNQ